MPARRRTEFNAAGPQGRQRTGYGPLAAAWLLLLGGGALAGWFVYTSAPVDRPVSSAALHRGDLPAPPAARVLAAAIDPRVRQLAARDTPTRSASESSEPSAAAAPARDDPAQRGSTPTGNANIEPAEPGSTMSDDPAAVPSIPGRVDEAAAGAPATPSGAAAQPPQVQLAARTDGAAGALTAAGPLPPPVPRSVVGPLSRAAARDAAGRYSVQVGAFRLRENAVERAALLGEAGYDVRIVHALATRSRLFMVRLGSFDARPAAIAYARRLAQDVGVETWPVRN